MGEGLRSRKPPDFNLVLRAIIINGTKTFRSFLGAKGILRAKKVEKNFYKKGIDCIFARKQGIYFFIAEKLTYSEVLNKCTPVPSPPPTLFIRNSLKNKTPHSLLRLLLTPFRRF